MHTSKRRCPSTITASFPIRRGSFAFLIKVKEWDTNFFFYWAHIHTTSYTPFLHLIPTRWIFRQIFPSTLSITDFLPFFSFYWRRRFFSGAALWANNANMFLCGSHLSVSILWYPQKVGSRSSFFRWLNMDIRGGITTLDSFLLSKEGHWMWIFLSTRAAIRTQTSIHYETLKRWQGQMTFALKPRAHEPLFFKFVCTPPHAEGAF